MVAKFNKKIGCCDLSVGLNAIVLMHIIGAVIAGVMIIIEMCKTDRSLKDEHHFIAFFCISLVYVICGPMFIIGVNDQKSLLMFPYLIINLGCIIYIAWYFGFRAEVIVLYVVEGLFYFLIFLLYFNKKSEETQVPEMETIEIN
ncbi:unnamed protein product [Chironomus riparius]|uniref:Uncharacterized protein n=1 Tax=Chironomus riparius TaxID=315576 RepID=A0A9N9S9W8_9DIPT|nr:unnamed protein product [Chironomus riparius]